jgi:HEAT repeat protein
MSDHAALESALRGLGSQAEDERASALRALLPYGGSEPHREALRGVLPGVLADGSARVRRLALVLASGLIGVDELVPLAIRFVQDPDGGVRLEAVGVLGELGRPETRGALAAALEDEDGEVRFEAACGMAGLRHAAGLEVLVEALDVAAWRFRALACLGLLGDARALPAVQVLCRKFFLSAFDRTQAMGVALKLGDDSAARHLFERSRKRWGPDRAYALELLGELKPAGARTRLLEVLADVKDTCRGAAARALGRHGGDGVGERLLALFQDSTLPEGLRLDAAEGLVLLGEPRWREQLTGAVEGFSGDEARQELKALLEEAA